MSLIDIQTPPADTLPAEVAGPAETYHRLTAEMHAEGRRARELARSLTTAHEQDRRALAAALRDGKKDPGTPASTKLQAELADVERRLDAYRTAVAEARAELERAILSVRDRWQPELAAVVADAEADYRRIVDELDRAQHRMSQVRATAAWLARFPRKPILTAPDPSLAGNRWSTLHGVLAEHGLPPRPSAERLEVDERPHPWEAA